MVSISENAAGPLQRMAFALFAAIALVVVGPVAGAAAAQKTFDTPEAAVKELVAAARADDTKALLAVLGPDAKGIISSGDAVADHTSRERFVQSYDEANKLEPSGDARTILAVGKDAWPMPIPLVKTSAGWRFDAKQGAEEILNRRIGRNELAVIQVAQAFVDAQKEYYLRNPMQEKLLQYAQKFGSSKGKKDGLYYPVGEGEQQSPLGQLVAKAHSEGYTHGTNAKPIPYFGYYYRIMKAQGPDAPGGAYDYVVRGKMLGGFALVAYPATYGNSGVMTFIVNQDGIVYEKDLGPKTTTIAGKMTKYNPDSTWKRN